MSKRPAPPGRKGSVKRETFKAEDTSDVTPPPETPAIPQATSKNVSSDDQLAERRRQEEEALQREVEARRQREREEESAIRARAEQLELEERLRQTRLQEENIRLERQAIARVMEEAEANVRTLDRAEQNDDQKKLNGAEAERTRAERLRLEAMALAEAEEAARLAAAALQAEAEAARQEAAAARQAEAEAAAARRAQEEAAKARRAEAEAAALAEEQRRREQEELARQQRKAEREAERQRLIEEHQRKLQEEEEAEKAAIAAVEAEERRKAEADRARLKAQQQAEAQRLLDEEEAELAEVRRKAAEQRQKRASFLSDMDSFSTQFVSQTAEKESQLQDAERKKEALRENIATLPAKPVDAPRVRKNNVPFEEEEVKTNIIDEPIYVSPATVSVAPTAQRTIVVDKDTAQRSQATLSSLADNLFNSSSAATVSSASAPAPVSAPVAASNRDAFVPDNTVYGSTNVVGDEELRMPTKIGGANKQSKAAAKGATMAATAAAAASPNTVDAKRASASMPAARPGYNPPPSATTTSPTPTTSTAAPIVPTGRGVVVVNNEDDDDDEEEGAGALNSISNILTREERRRMTMAEKASWKAKQADLNTRRKDFHGAVTYMFDGIFSWQMYGSAEALDEFGNTYTEYLMRCQWGTSFDNLQPWIVAHRYREFDRLDQEFRKRFPALEATMPRLPKKEFFWSMETNVVSKRRQDLEEYMVKIVQSMPSFMRSDLLDTFLNITERIGTIKTLLNVQSSISLQRTVDSTTAGSTTAAGHANSSASGHAVRRDSTRGHAEEAYANATETQTNGFVSSSSSSILGSDPLGASTGAGGNQRRGSASRGGPTVVDEDEDREARLAASQPDPSVFYWTVDEAEEAKEAQRAQPMVEDELGRLEEDIRAFYLILRGAKGGHAAEIVAPQSSARRLSQAINQRWPRLRATAVVNLAADFILIPRAMQAEEDYVRCLQEFRNLEVLQGYAI